MKFLLLVGFLYEPIARLHGVNQTLQNGLSAARRVFEILDRNDAEDLEDGSPAADIKGHVRFENITFAYNEGKPVLRNVSLEVPARQTIAVVGATGSGKTTLFQLLARFYDAEQGQITLDDKPLQYYAKTSLRQTLSYVTQDAFLFAGTIRGNLLLGCPSATEDQLWEALRLASAEDFVRAKTDGLDSQVGERGVMLSGGERQRIAMARAFLKDAPILLLDEATSAVDTKSEHAIQAALDALRKDRTCMVIAHRLSTVIAADQIYVLRLGEIVAHGSHEELLKSSPYYAELAALAFDSQKH